MRLIPLMLAGAMLAATAAQAKPVDPETRLAKALEGRVAGKPVSCINLRDIRSSQIIDRTAIVYDTGSRLYVNRPSSGARSLDNNDILVTDTHSSQLCNVDIVRLVDRASGFPNGFVGLDQFVPYAKPSAKRTD